MLTDAFGIFYPVRREARYVWGATGDRDEVVTNRGGVFHSVGADGLPDMGFTVSGKDGDADLRWRIEEHARQARESPAAVAWLRANPDWWKFEVWAHDSFSKNVIDSVVVHGGRHVDAPDETSPGERCSWCSSTRPLVLAGEFCSDSCMTDYVTAWGADGLDLRGGFDARDTRGVATPRGGADDALDLRTAA
ncbi:hypothetical protein [Actinomadura oligospora]|uniref:hypothetical protein n=1 Tax=Actinomadura oligospora TaxID=111804 RepID=UPI0014765921|nr:hypothetical protein [Actinomadura oligospora]